MVDFVLPSLPIRPRIIGIANFHKTTSASQDKHPVAVKALFSRRSLPRRRLVESNYGAFRFYVDGYPGHHATLPTTAFCCLIFSSTAK
jgi:hypothetical protein